MPGIDTISAYVVGIVIVLVIFGFMIKSVKKISFIIMNTLFGGALLVGFNIMGMQIPITFVTVGLTVLLGVPGVLIILVMKFVLGVL